MPKCIFIDAASELSIREVPDVYRPEGSQALVKVEYSGINPADIGHALFLGMNDNVCGYEFCGTVVEAGPTSRYAVGDVVFGSNEAGPRKPSYHGAHQDFLIAESDSMSMTLAGDIPHAHAAALSIMVRTAADALLDEFEIPFPAIGMQSSPTEPAGAILIWGGATTVGSAAIQLAKNMKVGPIFATASSSNHEALIQLGATQCFDYRDPDVVASIRIAIEKSGKPLKYVFDTVCAEGNPGKPGTIDLCESLAATPDVKLACVRPQPRRPRWKMVLASRARDFEFPPPLGPSKARPEWEPLLEHTVKWAMTNYGKEFRIPNVTVVQGAEAGIDAIKAVFEGRKSFQKLVIKHPL